MKTLIFFLVLFFSGIVYTQEIITEDIIPLNGFIVKMDTVNIIIHKPKQKKGEILSYDYICSFLINNVDKKILIFVDGVLFDNYKIKKEIVNENQLIYYNSNRKYKSSITLNLNGESSSLIMVKRKRLERKEIILFSNKIYFDDSFKIKKTD